LILAGRHGSSYNNYLWDQSFRELLRGAVRFPSWNQSSSSYTTLPICKGTKTKSSSVAKVCFKIVLEHVSEDEEEEEEALIEITLACLSTGLLTYLEYGSSNKVF